MPVSSCPLNHAATWTPAPLALPPPHLQLNTDAPCPVPHHRLGSCLPAPLRNSLPPTLGLFNPHHQMTFPSPEIERVMIEDHRRNENDFLVLSLRSQGIPNIVQKIITIGNLKGEIGTAHFEAELWTQFSKKLFNILADLCVPSQQELHTQRLHRFFSES